MFNEAAITINGTKLTMGQSMTVRIALTEFRREISTPAMTEALGPLQIAYYERVQELLNMIGETPA